jgi:hypothetical protein
MGQDLMKMTMATTAAASAAAAAYLVRRYRHKIPPVQAEPEPIGAVQMGQVTFDITRAWFTQGYLALKAVAGAGQAGHAAGVTTVRGPDGRIAYTSKTARDIGVKTTGSSWDLLYTLWIMADREPEPEGGFDYSADQPAPPPPPDDDGDGDESW